MGVVHPAAASLLLLTACAGPVLELGSDCVFDRQSFGLLADDTAERVVAIDVGPRAEIVIAEVVFHATGGRIRWELTRDGETLWSGRYDGGHSDQHVVMPATVGPWRLEYATEDFDGNVAFSLRAEGR